ncbi:MAG: DUF2147 domain-containing protein [Bacteroidia bacterium]|jgi:uncharacterized protein (DUF2147 family)|nr:DUF2147 domain-containing protein [Bacteroidia bacterium]
MIRTLGFLLAFIGLSSFSTVRYADADINGIWFNQEKDGKIKVYSSGGKHYGYIIWLKIPNDPETGKPQLDKKNPDKARQTKPVKGLEIMKDLVWDASDQEWDDGEIYDPKSGNSYSLTVKMTDKNTLSLRGYMGVSLLGRTSVWTRTTQ